MAISVTWIMTGLSLLLQGLLASAAILKLSNPSQPNSSRVLDPSINILAGSGVDTSLEFPSTNGCYNPPRTKTNPLQPVLKEDCYQAADDLLDEVFVLPRDISLTFGRKKPGIDIQLPANSKYQTCGIYIDVINLRDKDSFELWTLYGAALDLISRCTTGGNRYGGFRTVGPKGVVNIVIGGGLPTPPTVALMSAISDGAPIAARAQAKSAVLSLTNAQVVETSSSEATIPVKSTNISEYEDCFDLPIPRPGLYPTNFEDCYNAAQGIIQGRQPFNPVTFARKGNASYRLPKIFRNKSCVISVDVTNDYDKDKFTPYRAYTTAIDLIRRCTQGPYKLGGRTTIGPRRVVNLVVSGRPWPPVAGELKPTVSEAAIIRARAQPVSKIANPVAIPQPGLATPAAVNTTPLAERLRLNVTSVTNISLAIGPECFDSPLPRERAWPINFEDCEQATYAIVGDRDRQHVYIFSRKDVPFSLFYYPLPTTLRYKSCVILIDMINDQDEDAVRLAYVESTAWVLAHACSGLERPEDRYGGKMTVGMGSKGLINVWVYGRLWPPPVENANSTTLSVASGGSMLE